MGYLVRALGIASVLSTEVLAGPEQDHAHQARLQEHWKKMNQFLYEHETQIAEAARQMKDFPRPNNRRDLDRYWFWTPEGAFVFNGHTFFADDPEMNLYFIVRPKGDGHHGFQKMHKGLNSPAIIFSVLKGPFDPAGLSKRISHVVFAHELTHHFDAKRSPAADNKTGQKFDKGDHRGYFNDPLEFNAYYQEALTTLHSLLEMGQVPKDMKQLLLHDSFPEFKKDFFARFLDEDFQKNLEDKYKKKLDKRLYGFWKMHHDNLKTN